MGKLVKDLARLDTLKVAENGVLTDFIVVQHNWRADLNGKGKTLLMRKMLLDSGVSWGSDKEGQSWENAPELRNWLADTYAKRLSADTLETIVPTTIEYVYGRGTGRLKDQKFWIPLESEVNDQELLTVFWKAWLGSTEEKHMYFGTRETQDVEATNSDNTGGFYYRCSIYRPLYYKGDFIFSTAQNRLPCGDISDAIDTRYKQATLVCMCVDENATITDAGRLTSNKAPEIESNFFGQDGAFGRWTAFGFAYRVSDPDGDPVTVTEKIDGVVQRTFAADQNGIYRFHVSTETLQSFEKNTVHTLTVEAFDGETTTSRSCKVCRIRAPGYVVYIGQIKGTADGKSYYWTERNVLDDPYDEDAPVILDPEVTLEANEISSFSFTVPVSNPHYDKLELKKPVISIEEDGREIFMGYITEMSKNLYLDIEVTCESELGYLKSRQCQVKNQLYTAQELMELALAVPDDPTAHIGFKGEGKVFLPGDVTVVKPESDTDRETAGVSSCWDVLTNSLTGKYGGYLRLRKEIKMVDGVRVYTRYLDYLAKLNDKTAQVIELGKNLLDISYYVKAGDIVNSVKAIGWTTRTNGFWFWATTETVQLTAEAYNGESIKRYGLCQKTIVVEGTASTTASLMERAEEELKKYSGFTGSIQVNAADLADVGVDIDRLDFMKETYVLSEPHGIDDWLPCAKEVIPLHELDQKDFTFGATTQKLSSLQAANFGTAGRAWNAIQSTIGYLNSK